jgi:Streptomycin adenylyltransferase
VTGAPRAVRPANTSPPFLDRRPAALSPLPTGYHALFDRLLDVVDNDARIRALWLSGSLARGDADAGSDLDVILAVRDDDFDEFAAGWPDWLATITPTVIARSLPFAAGCFYSLTTECLRLDVVSEPVSKLPESPHRRRAVVLDRDGLDAQVPTPADRPPPDPDRIAHLVEEFYRLLAMFVPVVVLRQDWLLGMAGVQGNRQALYELFVEANQPLPPMGVKQWSSKLTPAQRTVLEDLPAIDARLDSLVTAMWATAEAWRTHGRATVQGLGMPWPSTLAETVQASFEADLSRLRLAPGPAGHA